MARSSSTFRKIFYLTNLFRLCKFGLSETIEADENKFNLGGATLSKVYPVALFSMQGGCHC